MSARATATLGCLKGRRKAINESRAAMPLKIAKDAINHQEDLVDEFGEANAKLETLMTPEIHALIKRLSELKKLIPKHVDSMAVGKKFCLEVTRSPFTSLNTELIKEEMSEAWLKAHQTIGERCSIQVWKKGKNGKK
jgi:hypothetical protein